MMMFQYRFARERSAQGVLLCYHYYYAELKIQCRKTDQKLHYRLSWILAKGNVVVLMTLKRTANP